MPVRFSLLVLALCALSGCASAPKATKFAQVEAAAPAPAAMDLDADLARLSEWFGGEWDNYEQVYLEKEAAGDPSIAPAHERIHLLFKAVDVPALGGSVFFARQTLDDDPARLFRLRLYRFVVDPETDSIRLDQYNFRTEEPWRDAYMHPARLAALKSTDLRYAPDCAVYFKRDPVQSEYLGETRKGACKVGSERLGKAVVVEDQIRLSAEYLSIMSSAHDEAGKLIYGNRDGVPHRHRKVRYFEGWVVMYRGDRTANPNAQERNTLRNIVLHSEGRVLPLTWEDGRRSGYSLQLARLSFQDDMKLLTLKLLDDATGQPVSYVWADPQSAHIGMNLQWFQSGLTEVKGDSRFDPKPAPTPAGKPR